ncbi:hypothetical protein [Blastococcus tunisiensis]|uniref:hypothetical protein n=1 Tax=Blastococcus tunisiensis TaxID=1798228 RepID=UPI0020C85BE3|nr:hypothetical protein [Blastococcus sp. DSM 46838]
MPVGLVLGRCIGWGDRAAPGAGRTPAIAGAVAGSRTRRRALPLPPVGVALVATAVALQVIAYALRLSGATGSASQAFSLDGPLSVPRMFVAGLFAVGAIAAVVAAARMPDRRVWWFGVAVLAAGIAAARVGGIPPADARGGDPAGGRIAVLVGVALVVGAGVALWFLSRTERRDRRRVLGGLVGYAAASVGSFAVADVVPASWAAATTFIGESGAALAGVAFLFAVLVGAAPRLVLPADWVLRRTADARTVDVAAAAPFVGRVTSGRPGSPSMGD